MVDLSGILRAEFNNTKKGYEKAVKENDARLLKSKARRCAQLLREIAENTPGRKEGYINSAAKWDAIAISAGSTISKPVAERESPEGEFESHINGLISSSSVTWEDIGGLEDPKRLLMETVVIAGLKKPESIKPWRGILLFGPPGTGKTLLAASAAGSLGATFFNVSADKVLSKYYGETPKLIASLYETATKKAETAPSIVFIDEFDALSLSRSGDVSEASRRALGTLLAQLDGFRDKKTDKLVLTLVATNTPWDLDNACLSRFPRRIYVPLPDAKATEQIVRIQTKDLDISKINIPSLAQQCCERSYSGREIAYLCQQAMWNMIQEENIALHKLSALPFNELKKRNLNIRPLKDDDFYTALDKIKSPLSPKSLQNYEEWAEEFGG